MSDIDCMEKFHSSHDAVSNIGRICSPPGLGLTCATAA
ncbi:hypothetical protein FHY32_002957 [Xanthomonas axonopodis]|uniref:Uncharacterized protein n=1 Tax=Xanthomonas euvesicatoria TaxID=456327 RepID=A0AAW3U608_XANEU|nr:hypothetical protein [Xanthomonas euvesicatoria]